MPESNKPKDRPPHSLKKLPPKGTAARLALASGLWSHMTPEEIEHINREIFGFRRSRGTREWPRE